MKKFCWVGKDYGNRSLNGLAQRLAEYFTADLLLENYTVEYTTEIPTDAEYAMVGQVGISDKARAKNFGFTVSDTHLINDIFNYNIYFPQNTETLDIAPELKGTFDCLVSLAAGEMIATNPADVGLTTTNHYVIDISPTAIHKSMSLYKDTITNFTQLDIFNSDSVKSFLSNCEGTKGFFVVSNCFRYIINSLLYDVELRLKMQNEFIKILANDKIDWYVTMFTADGTYYPCVRAKDIQDKILDERFKVFPWIK
jgi:hypothetical protein